MNITKLGQNFQKFVTESKYQKTCKNLVKKTTKNNDAQKMISEISLKASKMNQPEFDGLVSAITKTSNPKKTKSITTSMRLFNLLENILKK